MTRLPPSLLVGGLLTGVIAVAGLLALVWTPSNAVAIDVASRLLPPGAAHPFGTDHFGRDVLSMLMAATVNSFAVALVAVAVGMGCGVPLGLVAASRPGAVDELVMRGGDVVFAFPSLLLAVMVTAVLGPGTGTAALAIGVFNVPVFARVTRGAALPVLARDFILAARTSGKGGWRIALDHVLPNIAAVLTVQATVQLALAILAEAGLSYVGLGVQPPQPSWGRMLAEAQTLVAVAPWLGLFPGLAIVAAVLGLGLAGDGLRDMLDPRRNRR